jgi:hypothetical protein
MIHRTKAIKALLLALAMLGALVACKATTEGEVATWRYNTERAGKFKVKYEFAASAIQERQDKATIEFEAAKGLSGEAAIQKMSAANYSLSYLLTAIDRYDGEIQQAERLKVQVPMAGPTLQAALNNAQAMLLGVRGRPAEEVKGAFDAASEYLDKANYAIEQSKNGQMPSGIALPTLPTGYAIPNPMPLPPMGAPMGVPPVGVPGSGVPGSGVPGSGVDAMGVPGSGVPGSGVPGSGVPGSGVPGSGVPGSGVPGSGVPGSGVPGSGVPGSGVPGSGGF